MMDFNYPTYTLSKHAILRTTERIPDTVREDAETVTINLILEGKILFDVKDNLDTFRYVRNDKYLFPCVKIGELKYKVLSVLTWEMICKKENVSDVESLQYRLKKYHDK